MYKTTINSKTTRGEVTCPCFIGNISVFQKASRHEKGFYHFLIPKYNISTSLLMSVRKCTCNVKLLNSEQNIFKNPLHDRSFKKTAAANKKSMLVITHSHDVITALAVSVIKYKIKCKGVQTFTQ